jgi:hypothetical protein
MIMMLTLQRVYAGSQGVKHLPFQFRCRTCPVQRTLLAVRVLRINDKRNEVYIHVALYDCVDSKSILKNLIYPGSRML